MITLQDKYSSTTSPQLPPHRNEKSHFVSCSDSAGSSSCTTPSTTTNMKISNTVKKISHHTSPPTTKELAYLDQGNKIQYQVVSDTSARNNKKEENVSQFAETSNKIRHPTDSGDKPSCIGSRSSPYNGQTSQYKDIASLGLLQQPKMRVVHPPRGAHHMYSTASSSSSSLSSNVPDPHRGSTASHVRKRNIIIFDENDEDTLI